MNRRTLLSLTLQHTVQGIQPFTGFDRIDIYRLSLFRHPFLRSVVCGWNRALVAGRTDELLNTITIACEPGNSHFRQHGPFQRHEHGNLKAINLILIAACNNAKNIMGIFLVTNKTANIKHLFCPCYRLS